MPGADRPVHRNHIALQKQRYLKRYALYRFTTSTHKRVLSFPGQQKHLPVRHSTSHRHHVPITTEISWNIEPLSTCPRGTEETFLAMSGHSLHHNRPRVAAMARARRLPVTRYGNASRRRRAENAASGAMATMIMISRQGHGRHSWKISRDTPPRKNHLWVWLFRVVRHCALPTPSRFHNMTLHSLVSVSMHTSALRERRKTTLFPM